MQLRAKNVRLFAGRVVALRDGIRVVFALFVLGGAIRTLETLQEKKQERQKIDTFDTWMTRVHTRIGMQLLALVKALTASRVILQPAHEYALTRKPAGFLPLR